MYAGANELLVRSPNLYFAVMGIVAFAAPTAIVLMGRINVAALISGACVIFFLFGIGAAASFAAGARDREIERNYRLARVIVYAALLTILPMLAWARPEWEIGLLMGPIFASLFAWKNLGEHMRVR